MKYLLLVFSLLSTNVMANDYLEQAIAIVIGESASLAGKEALLGITEREKVWEANVSALGRYSEKTTLDSASGPDAKVQLQWNYPLFSDEKGKDIASAKQDVLEARDRVIGGFLKEVTTLVMLEREIQVRSNSLEFVQLEAQRTREGVKRGIFESDKMTAVLKSMRDENGQLFLSEQKYKSELTRISWQYGGKRREELRPLLVAIVTNGQNNTVTQPQPEPEPEPAPAPAPAQE